MSQSVEGDVFTCIDVFKCCMEHIIGCIGAWDFSIRAHENQVERIIDVTNLQLKCNN